MASISEAAARQSQAAGILRDGQEALSLNQQITFQQYKRVVLPLDGYIFWLPSQGVTLDVMGSLHYTQAIQQNEDETFGLAQVTFTAQEQITDFVSAPVDTLYIATAAGFRFTFSQQQGLYDPQSALWHYLGRSVPPALATQLLDRPDSIDPLQPVVSNSLPLWLGLNGYASQFYDGFSNKGVPLLVKPPVLFPSFMVSPNETPPYGAVHIGENDTEALQSTPYLDRNRSHYQLVSDRVRITLYGLQNDACLDFMDTVNQYSVNTGNFGIMNMPVIRDAKRTQAELQTLAMKKVVDFQISYYQKRVAEVGRQLIKSCVATYIFEDGAQ